MRDKQLLRCVMRIDMDNGVGVVTAVWRDPNGSNTGLTCYAHVGQHAECSYGWYAKTKPATFEQYEPLRRELEQIYGVCKVKLHLDRYSGIVPL